MGNMHGHHMTHTYIHGVLCTRLNLSHKHVDLHILAVLLVMAADSAGYDCEFVEKPPIVVQSECPVCLQILREPYQTDCCGYAFCRMCIERVKAENTPCACCKAEKFDTFEDKRLKRTLYGFKVYCTNKKQGCQWVGELSQLDNHLNTNPLQENQQDGCWYAKIKCFFCLEFVHRPSIQYHQKNQCPKRPHSCMYCRKYESTYEDVVNKHWANCNHYPVKCMNGCGKIVKRKDLDTHVSNDCPLTVVDCAFSYFGCNVKLCRQDMTAHLVMSTIKHISLQVEGHKKVLSQMDQLKKESRQFHELKGANKKEIRQLKKENKLLRQENVHLRQLNKDSKQLEEQIVKLTEDLTELKLQLALSPVCPIEFSMTNFEQHRLDNSVWQSPPFYTHQIGYRMCMVVYANGYEKYKGTHTAAGVRLMKGEFDDQLEWPFRGYITIQLLSHEDHTWLETVLSFTGIEPNYDSIASRVLTEEEQTPENNIWAAFDFISHSDLLPKYLKYDCLRFCVYQYRRL